MKKSKSSRETESDKEPTLTAKERYTRWVTHLTFEAVLFKTEVLQSILNASLVEGNRMMQAEAGLLPHFLMYRG